VVYQGGGDAINTYRAAKTAGRIAAIHPQALPMAF
jgi:hypothetical protein